MSIVCETALGWVIDHEESINKSMVAITSDYNSSGELKCESQRGYSKPFPTEVNSHHSDSHQQVPTSCGGVMTETTWKCKPELFEIQTPFMMDSQFEKWKKNKQASEENDYQERTQETKKRKRQHGLNPGEEECLIFHSKVKDILENALHQLVELARTSGRLTEMKCIAADNNMRARNAARILGPGDSLADKSQLAAANILSAVDVKTEDLLLNQMVKSDEYIVEKQMISDHSYLVPPQCSYLMSQMSSIQPLLNEKRKYDVILIDPPWQSKSVKRLKKYNTIDSSELTSLPIKELASPGCLLLIWVTNRQQHHQYVLNTLLPQWNATHIGFWYWLKVTHHGQLVYALNSPHKKPYEVMVLARIAGEDDYSTIPTDKVIVSVPCSIHSRKPPLNEILQKYIPSNAACLEMFARNLLPYWTSWGNEVIKYQHTDYFCTDEP